MLIRQSSPRSSIAAVVASSLIFEMPGLDGLQLQEALASEAAMFRINFESANASISTAVEGICAGASDFLREDASNYPLLRSLKTGLELQEAT
jgi:two-component system, LuxR family, response regulator FixJ